MRLFGPLYERVIGWARHPHAERYLGGLSFAESSFFPIPPDVMLAPMCLAERERAWRFATITTVTSLLGGSPIVLTVSGGSAWNDSTSEIAGSTTMRVV